MPGNDKERLPSLSDQLRALGIKTGARDLPPPAPRNPYTIDNILGGGPRQTALGETYAVEARHPTGQPHGQAALEITSPLQVLAEWAGAPGLADLTPEAFAFLDTETTGLSGPSGTYAFLIGVGRFEADEFHLAQFFLRDPLEEPAQLAALEDFLAPCQAIVTFNGKAFDAPLLLARYTLHGWRPPLADLAHVDLLHLARRLWRERLPSRTLMSLEAHILGALRSGDDIPGWAIPALYFQYLRDGDARPLKSVFYHNAMDVLSLVALMNYLAGLLSDPLALGGRYSLDLIALARLFDDLGDPDTAARLYLHGLEHEDVRSQRLPPAILVQTLQRLALLHKRRQNLEAAIQLWEQAAHHHSLPAHVELAKCYEHQLKDYALALTWTRAALDIVEQAGPAAGLLLSPFERRQWQADLLRRLARLERLERKTLPTMSQNPEALKNLKHNLLANITDGAFFGWGIGFASFVTVIPLFVSGMTGSALLIGLIPAIHNAGWQFPQLFTARWIARQARVRPLVLSLTILERTPFLGLAVVAWFAPQLGATTALLLTFVLLTVQGLGAGLTANPWQSMMGKIIPDNRRGAFFGVQAGVANLLASVGAVLAGFLLVSLDSPFDFTACFLITSGLMVISWIFLALTREPASPSTDTPSLLETSGLWASMGDILHRDRNFRWFLAARMASQFVLMGFAFYTVYAVQRLGVTELGAGWMTGMLLGVSIIANILMGSLGDRLGHRRMMEIGLLAGVFSAVLAWWALTPGWFYLVFALEAVANVAVWTTGMSMTLQFGEESERPAYIGMANTFVAPANILAPFFGGWLADRAGYPAAFLAAAAGGLVAVLIFHFLVHDVRRPRAYMA